MAYHIDKQKTVKAGVVKIAKSQINKAIEEIDNKDLDPHETVHQVRKRCKKLRGLIRLIRPVFPGYKEENSFFRDAAGDLSFVRDAQSIIESVDLLSKSSSNNIDKNTFTAIRKQLVARRKEVTDNAGKVEEKLNDFRAKMVEALERVDTWQITAKDYDAISGGLQKTYKRGRKAFRKAYSNPSTERFHEWRKRVKYHWYHARLLRNLWPEMMRVHRRGLDKLSDILGDDHDLAILKETLQTDLKASKNPKEMGQIFDIIDRRRIQLQQQAKPLGELLYAEKKKHLDKRFHSYWMAWRD